MFDQIYDGACVADTEGIITHFNKPYDRIPGIDQYEPFWKVL